MENATVAAKGLRAVVNLASGNETNKRLFIDAGACEGDKDAAIHQTEPSSAQVHQLTNFTLCCRGRVDAKDAWS